MEHLQSSDFSLIQPLGSGSFGRTYLYQRKSDGEYVCIKKIQLRRGASVERENKILSELKSQYVIKYYGSFIEDGQLCIVMEYASAGCLSDLIKVRFVFCFCL